MTSRRWHYAHNAAFTRALSTSLEVVGKLEPPSQSSRVQQHRDLRDQPLQLSFGDSMQIPYVTKALGILIASSFSPSIPCWEAASKSIRMLLYDKVVLRWTIRVHWLQGRLSNDSSTSRPQIPTMKCCCVTITFVLNLPHENYTHLVLINLPGVLPCLKTLQETISYASVIDWRQSNCTDLTTPQEQTYPSISRKKYDSIVAGIRAFYYTLLW